MMNKNRTLEYVFVIVINILFPFFTNACLRSMPYISTLEINKFTHVAFGAWIVYGMALYLALKVDNICLKEIGKRTPIGFLFGFLTAVAKTICDYIMDKFIVCNFTFVGLAVAFGIEACIFGIVVIISLFCICSKKKKNISKRSMTALICNVADILIYIILVARICGQKSYAMKYFISAYEEADEIDFFYALKILSVNVWAYTFLMIFFWWLMRTLYSDEGDKQLISEGKENE
ncbi:MAG: hypothetical protein HDR20_08375 [Lachnospiraceae bacterium]|nr:hypothetical protein [Lachnospiraceae bacterium]